MKKKPASSPAYRMGRARLTQIHGKRGLDKVDGLAEIAPDLARWIYEWPFAEIYTRGGLTPRERQLVTLSSLITLGYARSELVAHLHGSLNIGIPLPHLIEVVNQLAIYAGFPASVNAVGALREVIEERKRTSRPTKRSARSPSRRSKRAAGRPV